VLRFAKALPSKQDLLIAELERLRQIALIYQLPDLLPNAAALLSDELAQQKRGPSGELLKRLEEQLRANDLTLPFERSGGASVRPTD